LIRKLFGCQKNRYYLRIGRGQRRVIPSPANNPAAHKFSGCQPLPVLPEIVRPAFHAPSRLNAGPRAIRQRVADFRTGRINSYWCLNLSVKQQQQGTQP